MTFAILQGVLLLGTLLYLDGFHRALQGGGHGAAGVVEGLAGVILMAFCLPVFLGG